MWLEDDIKTSVDAYRLHHQLEPMRVDYEKGFSKVNFFLNHKTGNPFIFTVVSQIPKNKPVNNQKLAAYLPIVLNNNKNKNKLSLTVKF